MLKPARFVVLLGALTLTACSGHNHVDPSRNAQPDLQGAISSSGAATKFSPLASSLEDGLGQSACDRLAELAGVPDRSGAGRFSYFSQLDSTNGWRGAIAIDESPLTQFILSEIFKVPDWNTFYTEAKKEHDAGQVSGLKWFLLNLMNTIGLGQVAEFTAVNDKLSAAFPGIFGETGALDASVHWQIAHNAARLDLVDPVRTAAILSQRMPLFPGDGRWDVLADSAKVTLPAALRGLRDKTDQQQKLCALVLLHQNFAQLLTLKGHSSPVITQAANGLAQVEKLSTSQPEFRKVDLPGAFYDLSLQRNLTLKVDDIRNYDPSARLLTVTSTVPVAGQTADPGVLGEALSFMEFLLYSYELSSPASPWVKETGYPFGDIQNPQAHAILPAEAHQLALGLLTMHFKNLAAVYVKKVNADGALVKDGEIPAGIVLVQDPEARALVRVRLDDAIRLVRIVAYFEEALGRFKTRAPGEWASLSPVYDKATLAQLLGKAVFSEGELNSLLPVTARASVLLDNISDLKLPLALLMSKMAEAKGGCLSEVEWNLSTGRVDPVSVCSKDQKLRLADAFELLGRETQSPLLMQKAEQLRK
jgi:hypothetical protein